MCLELAVPAIDKDDLQEVCESRDDGIQCDFLKGAWREGSLAGGENGWEDGEEISAADGGGGTVSRADVSKEGVSNSHTAVVDKVGCNG